MSAGPDWLRLNGNRMSAMNEHTRQAGAIRVTVEEAEARIAELLRRAEAGERIEITRDGRAVLELGAAAGERSPVARGTLLGAMEGEIWIAPDFDELGPEWDEYVK
jgi:antitoxin (DNA-binding transcriptional repressor) of toxin-antitoxin stability system